MFVMITKTLHSWLTRKILNSRDSRMAKTVTFKPWWQPFDIFCFETLSFFPLFLFFLFVTQKDEKTITLHPPSASAALFIISFGTMLCFTCSDFNNQVYQQVCEVVLILRFCSLNLPSVLGTLRKSTHVTYLFDLLY